MELTQVLGQIKVASVKAGKFIKDELHKVQEVDIEEKELNSLVSYVDKEAEKIIVNHLRTHADINAGFITEEDTADQSKENQVYNFVIDPLDGTTNFLKKIPHFAVSVSLEKEGIPIAGVVYDIMQDDLYSSYKGKGAFLNDQRIYCSNQDLLSGAIIATGFPYANVDYEKKFKVLRYWLENSRGIRRMGSAALDLVYIASGKLDVYYEAHLNRWDFSAGALIALEAGAKVTDFKASKQFLDKGQIIACSPALHEEVLEIIDGYI